MKKSIIVSSLLFAAVTAFAQSNDYNTIMDITDDASLVQENASVEFPYSKVLNATDSDLLAQRFRNDTYHNCWILTHSNGWGVVASILSDVNTPVKTDYKIRVQNGEGGKRSSVEVTFFDLRFIRPSSLSARRTQAISLKSRKERGLSTNTLMQDTLSHLNTVTRK